MAVNFRACKISRGMYKLPEELHKKKKKKRMKKRDTAS
jgi:hypothetical protein